MSDRDAELVRLSFVVPVYNPPVEVLTQLLHSLSEQSDPRWECVLVDDRSPDVRIRSTLESWVERDPRFRLIEREANGGIAAATNTGLDNVRGEIVAFSDHDDVLDPEAVAEVLAHFDRHPDDDVVYSDEDLVDVDGRLIVRYHKPDYSPTRLLGHNYMCHLVALRRDALDGLRLRTEFEPAQDFDFLLRVIESITARGRGVGHIARTLYRWRAFQGSIALDLDQKSGVVAAARRCVEDAAERRGLDVVIRSARYEGRPVADVQLAFTPPTDESITRLSGWSTELVADQIARSTARYLYLQVGDEPSEVATTVASQVARPEVGIAGPAIVGLDQTIVSAGRVVSPTLTDVLVGHPWDPGPWGTLLVAREVSAVAPEGAVIDVAAARAVGGIDTSLTIDVALAELSERMRHRGWSTVWTPEAPLTLDRLSSHRHSCQVQEEWAVVDDRLGGVPERFDPTGLQRHRHAHLVATDAARALIADGSVELVTSDVFDTVVTRPVATPSDLFLRLARFLESAGQLPDGVTPARFAMARRDAERRARRRPDRSRLDWDHECTLTEIWEHMPARWDLSIEEMIERELAIEAEFLRPVAPTIDVLLDARCRGIPVVLVSDTYMSGAQLSRVLADCGVDPALLDRVVTSSDHGRCKAAGLLELVVGDASVHPSRVLHLGDNVEADIAAAHEFGARAVHVALDPDRCRVAMPSNALVDFSASHGTDGGLTAAARAIYVAGGPLASSPPYQFGVAAAGPALVGFARWVASTASELGASTVHYLLREGATIAELVSRVAPEGPSARLVHASRWVTMRAAVVEGTVAELTEALARRDPITVDHVATAFDLDPAAVRRAWHGKSVIDPPGMAAAFEMLADDETLCEEIVAASAALRVRVMRQLMRELAPDALSSDSGPLVLCDVGWGGTIQLGIERILRAEGFDVDVTGLYLGLSESGEARLARGQELRSYLPNVLDDADASRWSRTVNRHADLIERLLMPATGTLIDVDDDGTPITDAPLSTEPGSLRIARRGVHDLADELARHGFDDDLWVRSVPFRATLAADLARTLALPDQQLATELVQWPHDDVRGIGLRPLGELGARELLPHVTAAELTMLRADERGWIEGLAAAEHPQLAAQLAAVRAGVPLHQLVPPSSTGPALLAAFPHGSDLACLRISRPLGTTADGWSAIRLVGSFPSLRSIRFDPGTVPELVEFRRFSVTITRPDADPVTLEIDRADDARIVWQHAWPVSARRFVSTGSGHLIVPVPKALGSTEGRVEVAVVFRRWLLDPADELLAPTVRHRVTQAVRRARRAAGRQIRRLPTR